MQLIVIPAYGRDYTNPSQVQKDWDDEKDFKICDMSADRDDGRYINKQQTKKSDTIKIRYNKLEDYIFVRGD